MPIDADVLSEFLKKAARHHPEVAGERARIARALEAAVSRARQKWPGVEAEVPAFLTTLGERLKKADGFLSGLTALRTSDLWASHAAAGGQALAVEQILHASRADIARTLKSMRLDAVELDEVMQRLRERVFVAAPGATPRIASYSGTGSLGAWLAAAATRLAIDLKRTQVDVVDDFEEKLSNVLSASDDPELQFMKGRYRKEFREVFESVFAALGRDDRNLLRLTFLDGLTIDELSPMLGIHRSSVARRLAKLREHLGQTTRARLKERLRVDGSDLESVMRLVTSTFDLSLSRILKDSPKSLGGSRGKSRPPR